MGFSSCSGPSRFRKEWRAVMLGRRWNVDGEPKDSSTFTVDVKVVPLGETRSL